MNPPLLHPITALLLAGGACTACGGDSHPPTPSAAHSAPSAAAKTASAAGPPARMPAPADFVDTIDNPWMPWRVGTRWRFVGRTADGIERITVTVTDRKRTVAGVRATVVRDVSRLNGRLLEETEDWYAQDSTGNVWYLGEATKEYDGSKVDTSGSWEAGVAGARAGIVMLARPAVGAAYRQEYLRGEAEDEARVLSLDASARVPYDELSGLLQTRDFTRLEPTADEHKFYAKGVGVVLEVGLREKDRTELVSMTTHP